MLQPICSEVFTFDGTMLGISDQSTDQGQSTIFTLPMRGGVPKRITPLTPSYMHGWTPDGTGDPDGSLPEPRPEAPALPTEMSDALEMALQKLPESYREAIELTKITGLSIQEAATVLGTTETAGHAGQVEDWLVLAQALKKLSPIRRAVVVLRFYEDLPEARIAEIARMLGGDPESDVSRAHARELIEAAGKGEGAPTADVTPRAAKRSRKSGSA